MRRLAKGEGSSPRVQLRIPEPLLKELRRLAEEDRRELSQYVRLILEDHIHAVRKRSRNR